MKKKPIIIGLILSIMFIISSIFLMKSDIYLRLINLFLMSFSIAFTGNRLGRKFGIKQIKTSKVLIFLGLLFVVVCLVFFIQSWLDIDTMIKVWTVAGISSVGITLILVYLLKKKNRTE